VVAAASTSKLYPFSSVRFVGRPRTRATSSIAGAKSGGSFFDTARNPPTIATHHGGSVG
jgi:hypothetical protein